MATDYDVIILGTGPAGLQAAIHAGRKKASVLVLGRWEKSSLFRAHVKNYCCLSGVSGEELLNEGRRQAEKSGAVFLDQDVLEIRKDDEIIKIKVESGRELTCRALVIATGISRSKLNVPGEKELLGKGVSYCVDCDANFFRDEKVAVAGGGSAAVAGALQLLFYASEVHLIYDELEVSESLAGQLEKSEVVLHPGRRVKAIEGEDRVEGVVLDDGRRLEVSGLFIELGAKGAIELAAGLGVAMDDETFQYIAVNKKQETNLPGVYAAGDICGPPWQMAKAVGEGCVAGIEAAAYAKKFK